MQIVNTGVVYYTGIGSRQTPPDVIATMEKIARRLASRGFTLRSGGADGADTAFERGASGGSAEIYLPWKGFNSSSSRLYDLPSMPAAMDLASTVHPRWAGLQPAVRKLHARNCFQVLGADLTTPSQFVVCWTPDGAETERERNRETGGTATAIVLAARRGIPVINLQRDDAMERLTRLVRATET